LEAELRQQWLDANPTSDTTDLHEQLSTHHGRTPGAIRSRLAKLSCDFEKPGSNCTPERAAELKALLDAEYAAARA
jgi:hypothetical protein